MPTYRLHRLDESGKFESSEALEASDDDEALKLVRATGHDRIREVWLLRRLVGRVLAA